MTLNVTIPQRSYNLKIRARDIVLETTLVTGAGSQSKALTFASRPLMETWAATHTPAAGAIMTAEGRSYQFVSYALAAVISDLPGFLPLARLNFGHWGVSGVQLQAANLFSGAVAVVDETIKIQAAMDYALANGLNLEGDEGRIYGITDTVVWGYRTSGQVVIGKAVLRNVHLQGIGGVWAAGTRPDPEDPTTWTYGKVGLIIGKTTAAEGNGKLTVGIENVSVDGNRLIPVGIHVRGVNFSTFDRMHASHCLEVGRRFGNGGVEGDSCTDSTVTNGRSVEWDYTASTTDGFKNLNLRTSIGLLIQSADMAFDGDTSCCCLYNLMDDGAYNLQMDNSKFWSGPTRTDPACISVWITKRPGSYQYSDCTFDDGAVRVEAFKGIINNNRFNQYAAAAQLQMRASAVGETAYQFIFTNNAIDTSGNADMQTIGTGTWATLLKCQIGSNRNTTGDTFSIQNITTRLSGGSYVTADGQTVLISSNGLILNGYLTDNVDVKSNRSLRLMANANGTGSEMQKSIILGNSDGDYFEMSPIGWIAIGRGQSTGGGPAAMLGFSPTSFLINPSNGAGGTDPNKQLAFDLTSGTWQFKAPIRSLILSELTNPTKRVQLYLSNITAGVTRAINFPDANGTLALAATTIAGYGIVDAQPLIGAIKANCRLLAVTNINLATGGAVNVDGVLTVGGMRVLCVGQTNPAENGIYLTAAGAWTRVLDADATEELYGAFVAIERGNTYGGTRWSTTWKYTNVLGTTAMSWYQIADSSNAVTPTYVNARTPRITVALTAPGTPAVNDIWIDIT
ncbi:MAG: hypothetical protein ACOH2H_16260 [Cypionkella sp.]